MVKHKNDAAPMIPFNLQPVFEGERVRAQPLQQDDFERLYTVASNPVIWEMHPEKYRYKREVFEDVFKGAMDSRGAFLILDRGSGAVIGSTRFCRLDLSGKEVDIGYTFYDPRFWRTGHNRELKRLMLDHAFGHPAIARVLFRIGEENVRSRQSIERLGARLIETEHRIASHGDPYVSVTYALERESYFRQQDQRSPFVPVPV